MFLNDRLSWNNFLLPRADILEVVDQRAVCNCPRHHHMVCSPQPMTFLPILASPTLARSDLQINFHRNIFANDYSLRLQEDPTTLSFGTITPFIPSASRPLQDKITCLKVLGAQTRKRLPKNLYIPHLLHPGERIHQHRRLCSFWWTHPASNRPLLLSKNP